MDTFPSHLLLVLQAALQLFFYSYAANCMTNEEQITTSKAQQSMAEMNKFEYWYVYESRPHVLAEFVDGGLTYRLIRHEDKELIDEAFLNEERLENFFVVPFPDETVDKFVSDAFVASELYEARQASLMLPHILCWLVTDEQSEAVGFAGISSINENFIEWMKNGHDNAFARNFKAQSHYEIFAIIKKEREHRGLGTRVFTSLSHQILANTNIKRLLFIAHNDNKASIRAGRKAGFGFEEKIIFSVPGDSAEHERTVLFKWFATATRISQGPYIFFLK